jgi:hypothetical protein
VSEEADVKKEIKDALKAYITRYYDHMVTGLREKGYSEETVRKVLAEELSKPTTVEAKKLAILTAEDVKMHKSNPNSPQIYTDELKTPIEEIIRKEAAELWRKEKRTNVPEVIPQEYLDKAMVEVLKRWQKTLREVKETVPKMAPPPEMPPEMVEKGIPICPKDGKPMKKIVETATGILYQCPQHPQMTKLIPKVGKE